MSMEMMAVLLGCGMGLVVGLVIASIIALISGGHDETAD